MEGPPPVAEGPPPTPSVEPPTAQLRRKLSGDEAALTAKNYRMAKELVGLFKFSYSNEKFLVEFGTEKVSFVNDMTMLVMKRLL